PKTSSWTALWPIVRYWENRGTTAGGPYWEFRVWPFYSRAHGRYRDKLFIWPFWGHKTRLVPLTLENGGYDDYEATFVLWPVLRWERHESDRLAFRKWWALPLLWHYETEDKMTGAKKEEFK